MSSHLQNKRTWKDPVVRVDGLVPFPDGAAGGPEERG